MVHDQDNKMKLNKEVIVKEYKIVHDIEVSILPRLIYYY